MKEHEFTLVLTADPNEEEAIGSAISDVRAVGFDVARVEMEPNAVSRPS